MKSVQNTYFNINISNNKGFASLYDEEKYLFTKIKFRVYWINKIKNICDVVHFVYPTLPQFPAKCGSGVPFFIYFDRKDVKHGQGIGYRPTSTASLQKETAINLNKYIFSINKRARLLGMMRY